MTASRLVGGGALALALAACQGSERRPPTPIADARPEASGPTIKHLPPGTRAINLPGPEVKLPAQDEFKLLEAGAAPRAPLRYQVQAGAWASTVAVERRQMAPTMVPRHPLPALTLGFEVTSVAPHGAPGALRLNLRAASPVVAPGGEETAQATVENQLSAWRRHLERRRLDLDVDARGQLQSLGFVDDPGGARSTAGLDEAWQWLLGVWVPLPEEPVGVGASWSVVTRLRHGSAVVKQTATYTLRARTADRFTIDVDLRRIGEHQAVSDPELPAGVAAELVALVRSQSGTVTVTPSSPVPIAGTLTLSSSAHGQAYLPSGKITQATHDSGTISFGATAPTTSPP